VAPCWAVVNLSQHGSSFLDVIVEKKFSDCWFGVRKKGVVKEDMRFVGIHLLVKVLSSRKEIGDGVHVTWDMGQFIVEVLQVLDPAGLSASNLLWLAEVLEVLVVGTDLDGLCGAKEEGSTTFESEQDSGEFLVVGVIVLFGREEAS
jgi:hypothetical protein